MTWRAMSGNGVLTGMIEMPISDWIVKRSRSIPMALRQVMIRYVPLRLNEASVADRSCVTTAIVPGIVRVLDMEEPPTRESLMSAFAAFFPPH